MALLQIAEPQDAAAPHQHRWALGIDLGTTHSLVAVVRNGAPECLPDEDGHCLLPSVVRYEADGAVRIGHEAAAQRGAIASVKRLMGRGYADIPNRESIALDLLEGDGMVRLHTAQGVKTPVEVSARILGALVERARASLGQSDVCGHQLALVRAGHLLAHLLTDELTLQGIDGELTLLALLVTLHHIFALLDSRDSRSVG